MSTTGSTAGTPTAHRDPDESMRPFAADFLATMGGVLLFVASCFDILQGGSAIANDSMYAEGTDYLYKLNMTTWGWVHVVMGVIGLCVAVAIMVRASWGQVVGMIIAGLSMLTNFAFLPHYPWWAATVIAFDAAVIWALSAQMRNYD